MKYDQVGSRYNSILVTSSMSHSNFSCPFCDLPAFSSSGRFLLNTSPHDALWGLSKFLPLYLWQLQTALTHFILPVLSFNKDVPAFINILHSSPTNCDSPAEETSSCFLLSRFCFTIWTLTSPHILCSASIPNHKIFFQKLSVFRSAIEQKQTRLNRPSLLWSSSVVQRLLDVTVKEKQLLLLYLPPSQDRSV